MKNLTTLFLTLFLVFSVLVLPAPASAQSNDVTIISAQSTTTLEAQLNTLQKELIVLLNKRVAMLQTEWKIVMEQRLNNLQTQLVSVLKKQVSLLQIQIYAKM